MNNTILQKTGLNERTLGLMQSVFQADQEIEEVLLFGSRAKGNYRPGSDIDLALIGPESLRHEVSVAGQLDELPLLYTFDVLSYNCIKHQPLRDHIDRVGISIYRRAQP